MYKFLICRPQAADVLGSDWCVSYNSKMYPKFNDSVKEAILIGYFSKKKEKWITDGTAMHQIEDYRKVRKVFPDEALSFIYLANDLKENSSDNPFFQFYADEFV